MESTQVLDCAGRRRSLATLPGYHGGRSPRNKGLRYGLLVRIERRALSALALESAAARACRRSATAVYGWARAGPGGIRRYRYP